MFPGMGPGISTHIKGVGQLMKAHGPNHYQAGLLHKLFVGFRPLLVSMNHGQCLDRDYQMSDAR
jgi:hypothetical protein